MQAALEATYAVHLRLISRHKVSVSRPSQDAVLECLGVFSVLRKSGKFSVLSQPEKCMSVSSQALTSRFTAHFQQQKFTKLNTSNRLSVRLHSMACVHGNGRQ